jgi:hypothetical protein
VPEGVVDDLFEQRPTTVLEGVGVGDGVIEGVDSIIAAGGVDCIEEEKVEGVYDPQAVDDYGIGTSPDCPTDGKVTEDLKRRLPRSSIYRPAVDDDGLDGSIVDDV